MNLFKFASLHNKKLAFIIFGISCVVASGCGFEVAAAPDLSVSSGSSEWVKNVKSLLEGQKGSLYDDNSAGTSFPFRDLGSSSYKGSLYDINSGDTYRSLYDESVGGGALGDEGISVPELAKIEPSSYINKISVLDDVSSEKDFGPFNGTVEQLGGADQIELERIEAKLAERLSQLFHTKIEEAKLPVISDYIEDLILKNAQNINSSFLFEYKKLSGANADIIKYFEALHNWRNSRTVGVPILTEAQLTVLLEKLEGNLNDLIKEKGTVASFFPKTVRLFLDLYEDAKKDAKKNERVAGTIDFKEAKKICSDYMRARARMRAVVSPDAFTATFEPIFAKAIIRDCLQKILVKNGVFGNYTNIDLIFGFDKLRNIEDKLNEFYNVFSKFGRAVGNNGSVTGLSVKNIAAYFACIKPIMVAYTSVVNMLLTPINKIKLGSVDGQTQKQLYKFLKKFKNNNMKNKLRDDRTFLDLATYFYAYVAGLVEQGDSNIGFWNYIFNLGIWKNSVFDVYDNVLNDKKKAKLAAYQKTGGIADGGLLGYFERYEKPGDLILKYTRDLTGLKGFADVNFGKTISNGLDAPSCLFENSLYNLAKALIKKNDAADYTVANTRGAYDDIINGLDELAIRNDKVLSADDKVDAGFVNSLRDASSKKFLLKLVEAMSKFNLDANNITDATANVRTEIANLVKSFAEVPSFLAYKPRKAGVKDKLIGLPVNLEEHSITKFTTGEETHKAWFDKEMAKIEKNGGDASNKEWPRTRKDIFECFRDAVYGLRTCFYSGLETLQDFASLGAEGKDADAALIQSVNEGINKYLYPVNRKALNDNKQFIKNQFDAAVSGSMADKYKVYEAKIFNIGAADSMMNNDFDSGAKLGAKAVGKYAQFKSKSYSKLDSLSTIMSYAFPEVPSTTVGATVAKPPFYVDSTKTLEYSFMDFIGHCYSEAPCSFSPEGYANPGDDVLLQAIDVLASSRDDIEAVDYFKDAYDSSKSLEIVVQGKAAAKGMKSKVSIEEYYTSNAKDFPTTTKHNNIGSADSSGVVVGSDYESFAKGVQAKAAEERENIRRKYDLINNYNINSKVAKAKLKRARKELERKRDKEFDDKLQEVAEHVELLIGKVRELKTYNENLKDFLVKARAKHNSLIRTKGDSGTQPGVINLDQTGVDDLDVDNFRFNYKEEAKPTTSYNITLDEFGDDSSKGVPSNGLNKVPVGMVSPQTVENIKRGYF